MYVVVVWGVSGLCTSGWGKLGGERVEVVEDKGRERFAQMRGSAVSVWEINSVPYSLFL